MQATAEHATAKIAVWWDMKDCPIPEGYDPALVRQSIEGAFKEKGYSGPVSVTAYGDQTQTSGHILQGLLSTGVSVVHTRPESTNYHMHRDMVEWRGQNPPPATMMIISDKVPGVFDWDLLRLQQRTLYNLFLAYSVKPLCGTLLCTSEEWCWRYLLFSSLSRRREVVQCAKLYCYSCDFDCQSLKKFQKHLSTYKHAREEHVNPTHDEVVCVTESWGRNYKATPEFATAKIQVWWDMSTCPIPEGYDAPLVRPSMEAAFKELGYSGPVSITAYDDHNHTPLQTLQALSSTGVLVVHVIPDFKDLSSDLHAWHYANPPQTAAIMMVISDHVDWNSHGLVRLLQENNYNLFLAYSFRPSKMSFLLTSAEWLWESLLAGSEKRALRSESESGGAPTSRFYCKLCSFGTKSIDTFRTHLSTDQNHVKEENRLPAFYNSKLQINMRARIADYDRHHVREVKKYRMSKLMKKKASPDVFLNLLRLTNRR